MRVLWLVPLLLAGCHRAAAPPPPAPAVSIEGGRVGTPDGQVTLRPPAGWVAQAAAGSGVPLSFNPPAGAQEGARLSLSCQEVPGGDSVAVSASRQKVLAEQLPAAWHDHGYELVKQTDRAVGGVMATVIESRLHEAGDAVRQVQYTVLRGTHCYVLTGQAPEAIFQAVRVVFDQAAESLKFGGKGTP